MNNSGNNLTKEILKNLGFTKEVFRDDDGDEIKLWHKNGITLYEHSWWLTELDNDAEDADVLLDKPISYYSENEIEPEIKFSFPTSIKYDRNFKSGFQINTDTQLKNLVFTLTNIIL